MTTIKEIRKNAEISFAHLYDDMLAFKSLTYYGDTITINHNPSINNVLNERYSEAKIITSIRNSIGCPADELIKYSLTCEFMYKCVSYISEVTGLTKKHIVSLIESLSKENSSLETPLTHKYVTDDSFAIHLRSNLLTIDIGSITETFYRQTSDLETDIYLAIAKMSGNIKIPKHLSVSCKIMDLKNGDIFYYEDAPNTFFVMVKGDRGNNFYMKCDQYGHVIDTRIRLIDESQKVYKINNINIELDTLPTIKALSDIRVGDIIKIDLEDAVYLICKSLWDSCDDIHIKPRFANCDKNGVCKSHNPVLYNIEQFKNVKSVFFFKNIENS